MRVLPDFQRRGFGQIMLNKLEEKAFQLGYKELCLDTTTKQLPAKKFYEKNGYIEVGRGQMPPFELIFYHKNISSKQVNNQL